MEEKIMERLDAIERYSLLGAKTVLTMDDVVLLTGLSKSHVYKMTCNKEIPHYKPNGKYVYFDKAEIEEWMKRNRVLTTQEAEQNASAYIVQKGGAR